MSRAFELITSMEELGVHFTVQGGSLGMTRRDAVHPFVDEVRCLKLDIISLLQHRSAMPYGVRLLRWNLIAPPVRVERYLTVVDTERSAYCTLKRLESRLRGDNTGAGNLTESKLIERLHSLGITVEILSDEQRAGPASDIPPSPRLIVMQRVTAA